MRNISKRLQQSNPNKQKGFGLVGVLVAVVVAGMLITSYMQYTEHQKKVEAAKTIGNSIAQYIAASEQRMSEDTTLTAGNYAGTGWLKLASCGGSASKAYLPCNFSTNSLYLRTPFTVVVQIPVANKPTAVITVPAPQTINNGVYSSSPTMAGEAIEAAKARIGTGSGYAGISSYSLNKTTGVITINTSANGGNNQWLCIYGCNKMEANIEYDNTKPEANRQLVNVSAIQMNATDAQINANNEMTLHANNKVNILANNQAGMFVGSGQSYVSNGNATLNVNGNQVLVNDSGVGINTANGKDISLNAKNNVNIVANNQAGIFAGGANTYVTNGQAFINGGSSQIKVNNNGIYLNTDNEKPIYLGKQTNDPANGNVTVDDMKILSMKGKSLSELLKFKLAQKMNDCYTTPNTGGRDFSKKMCHPGDYVAGIKFDGHDGGGGGESVYLAVCCPTS